MKLKDKRPDERSFNHRSGITDKRTAELVSKLDELGKGLLGQSPTPFEVYQEIAGFCKNINELVMCISAHCNYCAKNFKEVYPESYTLPKPDPNAARKHELRKKAYSKLTNDEFHFLFQDVKVDLF